MYAYKYATLGSCSAADCGRSCGIDANKRLMCGQVRTWRVAEEGGENGYSSMQSCWKGGYGANMRPRRPAAQLSVRRRMRQPPSFPPAFLSVQFIGNATCSLTSCSEHRDQACVSGGLDDPFLEGAWADDVVAEAEMGGSWSTEVRCP